jgi:hypothetical protein
LIEEVVFTDLLTAGRRRIGHDPRQGERGVELFVETLQRVGKGFNGVQGEEKILLARREIDLDLAKGGDCPVSLEKV